MPQNRDYWKTSRVVYRRKPQKRQALLTRTRLMFVVALVLLGLLYFGLYQLLHLPYFQITDIKIEGLATIPESDIRKFMEAELAGDRWRLIPRSNILFFSPSDTAGDLEQAFPATKQVNIKKLFPRGIAVAIQERTIFAIYCAKSADAAGDMPRCFFMDREGILFRVSPNIEGTLILKFTSDEAVPRLGAPVFSSDEIVKFESWIAEFKERAGLTIAAFQFKQNSPQDLWLGTDEGFDVIVVKDDEPRRVAAVLRTVLENEVKENRGKLEYLDARFGNKVFYKYR